MTHSSQPSPTSQPAPAVRAEDHVALVHHIANRVRHSIPAFVDFDDVVQAGMEGLLLAVNRYDPTNEATFASFAALRIEGAIYDYFRSVSRQPRTVRRRVSDYRTALNALLVAEGSATDDALCKELGWTQLELDRARLDDMHSDSQISSLNRTDPLDDNMTVGDGLESTEPTPEEATIAAFTEAADSARLHTAIEALPERQRFVIRRYYFDGASLAEISAEDGAQVSRISKIKCDAAYKLKAALLDKPGMNHRGKMLNDYIADVRALRAGRKELDAPT